MAISLFYIVALLAGSSAAFPATYEKRCEEHEQAAAAGNTTTAEADSTTTVGAGPNTGGGSCPDNFINVVFNAPVNDQPDFNGRFNKIREVSGANRWIGFAITPPNNGGPDVDPMQVPLMMNPDPTYMSSAMDTCKSGIIGKFPYMITFNEPDLASTNAANRVISAQEAADSYKSQIATTPNINDIRLIGPGPAFPHESWNKDFFDACGCLDKYHAVSLHLYDSNIQSAQNTIQALADTFPGKPIWITEIAPASFVDQPCDLDQNGVKQWMTEVLNFAKNVESGGKKVVERIFWNFGEAGVFDPSNPGRCDPYLTTMDNQATPILENLGTICK